MPSKRGHRRLKKGVIRTASGAISRSKESKAKIRVIEAESEATAQQLALEAATWKRRQENPALTIIDALKPEHGNVLLSMYKRSCEFHARAPEALNQYHISLAEKNALLDFAELQQQYNGLIANGSMRSSCDFSATGGHDNSDPFEERTARRARSIERRYKIARRRILESGPYSMFAYEAIVLENKELPRLIGDLRLAANALLTVQNKSCMFGQDRSEVCRSA